MIRVARLALEDTVSDSQKAELRRIFGEEHVEVLPLDANVEPADSIIEKVRSLQPDAVIVDLAPRAHRNAIYELTPEIPVLEPLPRSRQEPWLERLGRRNQEGVVESIDGYALATPERQDELRSRTVGSYRKRLAKRSEQQATSQERQDGDFDNLPNLNPPGTEYDAVAEEQRRAQRQQDKAERERRERGKGGHGH